MRTAPFALALLLLCFACDDGGGDDTPAPCDGVSCAAGEACQAGACVPQRRLDGGPTTDAAPVVDVGARPDAAPAAEDADVPTADAARVDADVGQPADAADIGEPADAGDVGEPVDVGEPADAADVGEPADAADVGQPADAADVGQPVDAADAGCVPGVEACNGLDDDCDGQTDEDFPALGAACADGEGPCQVSGTRVCAADGVGTVCDVVAGAGDVETCNGVDDDCDGQTDEDFPGVGEPCTAGVEACAVEGTIVCAADGESAACDAVAREAAPETCNGLDDDCDGATDEDFPTLGDACTAGAGACAVDGAVVCAEDGAAAVCDAVAREATDETCNGLDDDCDQATDEGFPTLGDACSAGVGACAADGTVVCTEDGAGTRCDAIEGDPTDEVCNGLDDDCSGEADDFVPQLPEHCGVCDRACDLPHAVPGCVESACVIERCAPGFVDLDGDPDNGCEAACRPSEPADELCDGVDNDCDGIVDGPDVCLGDAFSFCSRRARLGHRDALCEDFAPGALEARSVPKSPALPGDAPPSVGQRAYRPAVGDPATGGGHAIRVPTFGPTLRLSYAVRWFGGRLGAGVFRDDDRLDGDPAQPGFGYAVEVAGPADAATVRVLRFPEGDPLAEATAPDLADGGAHRVEATRHADGTWALRLDGRTLALDVDLPDLRFDHFDRVTLHAAATDAAASSLDDLVLELDADDDGHYAPNDNCPQDPNPAQIDTNADGVGSACDDLDADGLDAPDDGCPLAYDPDQPDTDGDGVTDACDTDGRMLLIDSSTVWWHSPWLVDPVSGVRHQVFRGSEALGDFAGDPISGRLVAVRDDVLEVVGQDGEAPTAIALSADRPAWLDDGTVLYQDGDGVLWTVQPDGTDPFVFETPAADEALTAYVDRDGGRVVLVRAAGGAATAEVVDALGRPVLAAVEVPTDGGGPPVVRLHPSADLLLVAGARGDATGAGVLDPARGVFLPLSDAPVTAALWTATGAGVYLMESTPAGARLMYRPLDAAQPGTPLAGPSPNLAPGVLGWLTPSAAPPPADRDGDGLHDRDDRCPDRRAAGWVRAPSVVSHQGGIGGFLSAGWTGVDWSVGYPFTPSGIYGSAGLRLVDAQGRLGPVVSVIDRACQCSGPNVAWSGQGYLAASNAVNVPNNPLVLARLDDDGDLVGRSQGPANNAYADHWIVWNTAAYDVLFAARNVEHARVDPRGVVTETLTNVMGHYADSNDLAVAWAPDRAFIATLSGWLARADGDLVPVEPPNQLGGAAALREVELALTAEGAVLAIARDVGAARVLQTQALGDHAIPVGAAQTIGATTAGIRAGSTLQLVRTEAGLLALFRAELGGGAAAFAVHLGEDGRPLSRPLQITPAVPVTNARDENRLRLRAASDGVRLGLVWYHGEAAWMAIGDPHCAP